VEAWTPNLSKDGRKLAFTGRRAGKVEVWEKSLVDEREAPIIADDYQRDYPQWSPDGTRRAYRRWNPSKRECQLMVWSDQNHNEEPLTALSPQVKVAFDWSPDGKRLVLSLENSETHRMEVWMLPVVSASGPHGPALQKIISDPGFDLVQPHFSPDGQWIVFEAVRNSAKKMESTLYVVPTSGGPWTRISEGKNWDDKPRWSPGGKMIYFVSNAGGFFNVWGIRFDPSRGKAVGEPFRVTSFENPSLMVPTNGIPAVGLSVTQDRLVVTVEERSGSIWVLDNVDR
jgi:Tol biopolymer transport system component